MSKDLIRGTVVKGYRIASGLNRKSPYPYGSIKMQLPYFRNLGLDLYEYYPATINVSIFPKKFVPDNPDYKFSKVKWCGNQPPEDFSFINCDLIYGEKDTAAGYTIPIRKLNLITFTTLQQSR